MPTVAKIVPHLWYANEAEEAARFYTSIVPGSHLDRVTPVPADTPSGPAGSVKVVEFTIAGRPFMAITARPLDRMVNESVSTGDDEPRGESTVIFGLQRSWNEEMDGSIWMMAYGAMEEVREGSIRETAPEG